jgi:hypothetical protein
LTIVRALSTAESNLLPPPLADAFDLGEVRIVKRFHTPVAALLKVTIVRGARIFWAGAPDEATTLSERAHLAHELVHVWQYRALPRTGLELLASRVYRYRLDRSRVFLSYGYEQQASIVEDYVRVREGAAPRWAAAPFVPIGDYERVIASAAGAAG